MKKTPLVNVDILVLKDNKILLGLLSKKWLYEGKQVYGVPGRDILFNETIGAAIKRNILEDLGCNIKHYEVIGVNANYAFGNHYIGIGVIANIDGEVQNVKNNDWDSWGWFPISKLPNNLFPPAKNVINSYLKKKVTVSE